MKDSKACSFFTVTLTAVGAYPGFVEQRDWRLTGKERGAGIPPSAWTEGTFFSSDPPSRPLQTTACQPICPPFTKEMFTCCRKSEVSPHMFDFSSYTNKTRVWKSGQNNIGGN